MYLGLQTVSKSLVRNMGYTFLTIIVLLFVLVPNFQVVLMTICCVAFTVVNVVGFAHFMGLTIETVTSIITILSLGLAVDYCAHIAITYVCLAGDQGRQEKAKLTLKAMGSAVWNGGFSTFLAFVVVSGSKSYVFSTFFKVSQISARPLLRPLLTVENTYHIYKFI